MSKDREYYQAHNKGMSIPQRRDWVRKQAKKEEAKNLPFEIGKPPRRKGRQWDVPCTECGTALTINSFTVIAVCPHCKHFNRFEDGELIDDAE
jgi:hypothetical protein